jgi:transketolase
LKLEPLKDKWEAFGWSSFEVDGHDHRGLTSAIFELASGPKVIIANTVKGRGVSFMENSVLWHYRSPNEDELSRAIEEILQAE